MEVACNALHPGGKPVAESLPGSNFHPRKDNLKMILKAGLDKLDF